MFKSMCEITVILFLAKSIVVKILPRFAASTSIIICVTTIGFYILNLYL